MTVMLSTTRKVQKSERGSFSVTLPSDWARAVGLANGSAVEVRYGGSRVIVTPLKEGRP
jgi:phosphate uptake regulator